MDKDKPPYEGDLPWEELSAPACRALHLAGYSSLEQLTRVTEKELHQLHGMGPKGLRILRAALHTRGMDFKPQ